MSPVVAIVLLTAVGAALVGGPAWRLAPAPAPSGAPDARIARTVTVGLAASAGALLAAEIYIAALTVHLQPRLLGVEGFAGEGSAQLDARGRALVWYPTIGSILFEVGGLLGLAGLVYLVASRRASARA